MRKLRGIRVPYFTSVKKRIHFVKRRVKSSIVKVQGCARFAKYLLIMFQVFLWLLGCIMLGMLAYWLKHTPAITAFLLLKFDWVPMTSLYCAYVLITAAFAMMVVGFLGFYVAFSDNLCLLGTVFAVVLVLFTALLGTGSPGFVKRAILSTEMIAYYKEASLVWGNEECDPDENEGSTAAAAAACVKLVFHHQLCKVYAEERTPRGETIESRYRHCQETLIDGMEFVEERIRDLFAAKVKVVAWWSLVVGVVMLFDMIYIALLMFDLRHTSLFAPITENPEDLLNI